MAQPSRDDLLDALLELQHDLGKYLSLPLAWLPPDAGPDEVREAALKALKKTRTSPTGSRSARDLWQAFLDEAEGGLKEAGKWPPLKTAVARALAWTETIEMADAPPDRAMITEDFRRVTNAIRDLIKELEDAH